MDSSCWTEASARFVVIMDSMLDGSLSKWEVKAPVPSACFRSLCRQLHKLHEAIVDLLPASQVLELFERVHVSFKLRLRSQLIKLGVTSDGGPQHGLVVADVTFYVGNLKSLSGLDSLDDTMDDIWDKS
ncbi:Vacuolar protein sorting-associated protein 54 [Lamellibrachia satsuma]|nr:Vacuolar protein sorting-associated protein 54 [Lamellibrachia satsuma]